MNQHTPDKELLHKYVSGGLNDKAADEIEIHILSCSICYQVFESLRDEAILLDYASTHCDVIKRELELARSSVLSATLVHIREKVSEPVAAVVRSLCEALLSANLSPAFAVTRGSERSIEKDAELLSLQLESDGSTTLKRPNDDLVVSLSLEQPASVRISLQGSAYNRARWLDLVDTRNGNVVERIPCAQRSGEFVIPLSQLRGDISLIWRT